jgi:[glutamine synthetase] adenylyltransferase / [glutamine synthetase]-adenylyl-L-tyrosine phosphorylase
MRHDDLAELTRAGDDLAALARTIDPEQAPFLLTRYAAWGHDRALAAALAAALVAAFPAYGALADARPELFAELAREGWRYARDRATYVRLLFEAAQPASDLMAVRAGLRRRVEYEKLRIAARELAPRTLDGADVEVTAAEIADLADAAIEVGLAEAIRYATERFGAPVTRAGAPSSFVVLGMGKLGGRELNAGSDIDLIYLYDTDEGETVTASGAEPITLHEYWSRVARRLTATLEISTPEGVVWRVDLRLRPEGTRGPIANSLPAAERYYETFGRLWERSALLRARPCAGDRELGREALEELRPFVYVSRVDPGLAGEMIKLVERARAELSADPARDLKLGPGGIRELEFFVQALQLVWGGREPRVQAPGTLDALRRLRGRGLVTDREARELLDAYVLLRRTEHRIQWATGLQTHLVPADAEEKRRLSRSLGYAGEDDFDRDLAAARDAVSSRLLSLVPRGAGGSPAPRPWDEITRKLDADPEALGEACRRALGPLATPELVADLWQLAKRPDDLLGSLTRERYPAVCPMFFDALVDAADPEQSARYLRTWLSRLRAPGIYVRPLCEDPRALRRLIAALGASAFIGNALANRPELAENMLWSRRPPTPASARIEVEREVGALDPEEALDPDVFVGALRRAKARTTIEVTLADLGGEIDTREATLTLSALADESFEQVTRFVLGAPDKVRGLAVIAVGKLGGNEIGYGSDLDVLFIFDPEVAPEGTDPHEYFARSAQKVIRLLSMPHPEGPGYELDTRLRPSGSHGLLVTSREAFARYHDLRAGGSEPAEEPTVVHSGAAWERQALIRARFCAGDRELGADVIRIAYAAAYERGAPPAEEIHRLRMRMQKELANERSGRYDPKLGRGGLLDIEFAVQYVQMQAGRDPRVRTTETRVALDRLRSLGLLSQGIAAVFEEGYRFLRTLEQRTRIVHGSAVSLLDEQAEGLLPLARRMGIRSAPRQDPAHELIARYRDVTSAVRKAYCEVIGVVE